MKCDPPNNALYNFEGNIEYQVKIEDTVKSDVMGVGPEQVVLRGSTLRNTEYMIGMTVYTGHDTKIMMNSMKASYKFSNLDTQTNDAVKLILKL